MVNGVLVDVENLRDCFRVVRRFVTLYQQFPCFIVQHFYHLLCLLYTCCKGVTAFVRSAIGAFTACVCSLLAQIKNWNELLVSLLRLVALCLLFVALTVTLADRAVVAGGLFTWNSLDKYAWSAFYTGVACIAFQVAASLLMVVSGCMKQGAKK